MREQVHNAIKRRYPLIQANPDASPPARWWNVDMDLSLISGVFTYGYGNYDELRSDPEVCHAYRQSCLDLGLGQDVKEQVHTIWDWPPTETLTKRLRRTTDILLKLQPKLKPKDTPRREVAFRT